MTQPGSSDESDRVVDAASASQHPEEGNADVEIQTTDKAPPQQQQYTQNSTTTTEETSVIRSAAGSGTTKLSDFVDDHLIAVRYGTAAVIGLLTAYGIAHTPFFFRYRTVSEIPASYFQKRRYLHCRLIGAFDESPGQPIVCHVRHLSPVERLLSKSSFNLLMKVHPSASLGTRPDESPNELIKVEIAGIQSPPDYLSYTDNEHYGDWLKRLAAERTMVSCQLLARQVTDATQENDQALTVSNTSTNIISGGSPIKRKIPGFEAANESLFSRNNQVAVCKLYYRPKRFQLFATDIGESMVLFGRAAVASDGLYTHQAGQKVVDTTSSVKDLQKDAAYVARLGRCEYEAAKKSYGMWADPTVRESRSDVVEEVEFQTHATIWRKLWRFLRGG